MELASASEQEEMRRKKLETKIFFEDMERNIRMKMSGLCVTPPAESKEEKQSSSPTHGGSMPCKPVLERESSSEFTRPRLDTLAARCRTISSLDGE